MPVKQRDLRGRLFPAGNFQFRDALQLLPAKPWAAIISLLQLEIAARACAETPAPFQEDSDWASHELRAALAANSLADEISVPAHEEESDKRASISEAPPPPQVLMRPVNQRARLTARISVNAAELSCMEEPENSADNF